MPQLAVVRYYNYIDIVTKYMPTKSQPFCNYFGANVYRDLKTIFFRQYWERLFFFSNCMIQFILQILEGQIGCQSGFPAEVRVLLKSVKFLTVLILACETSFIRREGVGGGGDSALFSIPFLILKDSVDHNAMRRTYFEFRMIWNTKPCYLIPERNSNPC